MFKLSLPSRDKDKSQLQAGTSFTPTLTGRVKSSVPSTSVFRRLKSQDSAASQTQAPNYHPLMVLRLSSPSFLDSVVHDGSSDNPLYVIDTVDNITKVRRSDPKGFVNISRVRWPAAHSKSVSRKNKDLTGVEVAFGKGSWRAADDFMGFSYSSLSSYRKFYIPHHKHSLKWKLSGPNYACTTETVRGPVAILEPAMQRAPPQLKILDPLFRVGTSRPQRMHNGLALSLLDFLLVTAMILLTPTDEWMNVTRNNPSESVTEHTSYSSFSSDARRPLLLHTSETTPEIELWRSAIPARIIEEDEPQPGEISDGSSSRATSRLSFRTDNQSVAQHSTYPHGNFSTHSGSSLSLHSHALSHSQHRRRRARELPVPPMPPFSHNSTSASSIGSPVSCFSQGQHSRVEPPPIPPLPTTLSTSPHDPNFPVGSPKSASPRRVAGSPTSSIHSRSLPTPPTSSASKPPLPLSPFISSKHAVVAPTVSPLSESVPSAPHRPTTPPSHSPANVRDSTMYPSSQHDDKSQAKANYAANDHISPPLPISARASVVPEAVCPSLTICTTDVTPALSAGSPSAGSADASVASEEGDPFDMPPAYSSLDVTRSSPRLHTAN